MNVKPLLKRFKNLSWERLDDFGKYFIISLLIVIVFLVFMSIPSFFGFTFLSDILNSQLELISKAFSVPITKDKVFGIDAFDIVLFFIIFIIILSWLINKLIKLKFKRKK